MRAAKTYSLINAKAHNLEIKFDYLLLQSEEISFDKTELGDVRRETSSIPYDSSYLTENSLSQLRRQLMLFRETTPSEYGSGFLMAKCRESNSGGYCGKGYSWIISTKCPSFCMTTSSTSLTNLRVLPRQSRYCGYNDCR
jgi:hypothetical protein